MDVSRFVPQHGDGHIRPHVVDGQVQGSLVEVVLETDIGAVVQ